MGKKTLGEETQYKKEKGRQTDRHDLISFSVTRTIHTRLHHASTHRLDGGSWNAGEGCVKMKDECSGNSFSSSPSLMKHSTMKPQGSRRGKVHLPHHYNNDGHEQHHYHHPVWPGAVLPGDDRDVASLIHQAIPGVVCALGDVIQDLILLFHLSANG